MPARLPIFPLSTVLFPGTPLPLHIFEARYRQMLADCLAGDRRFGITPVGARTEAPDPGAVGCTAEVRVNQELPDGRSNIVVLGGSRFVVVHLLDEPLPYHVAAVEDFADESGPAPDPDRAEALRALFLRYAALARELNDLEPEAPELPDDPAELSFHVAAAIDVDASAKQRLLAERSGRRRVEALATVLPALILAAEHALVIHRRAHTNGRGSARPTLAG